MSVSQFFFNVNEIIPNSIWEVKGTGLDKTTLEEKNNVKESVHPISRLTELQESRLMMYGQSDRNRLIV